MYKPTSSQLRAGKSLYLHRNYGCVMWPETGPVAIVHQSPANTPETWASFAHRYSSRTLPNGARMTHELDVRFGDAFPINCPVEIVTSRWSQPSAAYANVRGTAAKGGEAIEACKAAFQRGAELVIVPDAKGTFPGMSEEDAGEQILDACFGRSDVYDNDDLFDRRVDALFGESGFNPPMAKAVAG
jgi:hypothetical protein